jgi:hypothetical protein
MVALVVPPELAEILILPATQQMESNLRELGLRMGEEMLV